MTVNIDGSDCCVACGSPVPEGLQICPNCEKEIYKVKGAVKTCNTSY